MSQHSAGVLVAELVAAYLDEVHDSLTHKRTSEALTKVDFLRTRIGGYIERTDRVLRLREMIAHGNGHGKKQAQGR